jgi:hypothetical protein
MQTNAMEHGHSGVTAEAVILDLLMSAPVAAPDLKERVRQRVTGLKDKQYKLVLDGLVAARKVHGRLKVGKNGKPSKSIEAYAFGAPPPPPPPARERAPKALLAALQEGPLVPAELKQRVRRTVTGLTEADYKACVAELSEQRKLYGRRKRGANGKLTKTVAVYSLGPLAEEFVTPVVERWKEMRAEAADAGLKDEVLIPALLQALGLPGSSSRPAMAALPPGQDRDEVLSSVRAHVAREGHGALIPIRRLRSALQLAKDRFDAALLELYGDDAIILHHHDYVGNLTEAERNELVMDRHGNYYIGVALRGEP